MPGLYISNSSGELTNEPLVNTSYTYTRRNSEEENIRGLYRAIWDWTDATNENTEYTFGEFNPLWGERTPTNPLRAVRQSMPSIISNRLYETTVEVPRNINWEFSFNFSTHKKIKQMKIE